MANLPPTGFAKLQSVHLSDDNLAWIANLIWGIADDVVKDVYVRGK